MTFTEHDLVIAKALCELNQYMDSYYVIQHIIYDPEFQRSVSKNCACALDGWIASCFANAEGGPRKEVEHYNIDDVPIEERLRLRDELFKKCLVKQRGISYET